MADGENTTYDVESGTIYSDGKTYLKIGCRNGWITVRELQLAGKKRLNVKDFLRGFPSITQFRCLIG
jgi:methionyl-tRNA formyltransferase